MGIAFGNLLATAYATIALGGVASPPARAISSTQFATPTTSLVAPAPHSAADFWNSMGVNVHMYYSNTPYKNVAGVLARLEQLDFRHVRDGLAPNRPDEISALQALGGAGIKATLMVGTPGQSLGPLLQVLAGQLASDVEAIEGPNEYWSSGPGWQARLMPFQSLLYDDVKDTPGLASNLVVGPSVGGIQISSDDRANIHPYPGGGPPESNIAGQLAGATSTFGDVPVWATETGYHDAVNATPGSSQPAATDAAQAVYLPRLFAAYFRSGISRTFIYELADEFADPGAQNPEARFGLLDHDLQPKPQFYALARLATAVQDSPDLAPQPLDYTISDLGTGLQQLLLSRSDESFQILLWRPVAVDSAGTDTAAATAPLALNLPFCADTTVLDPSQSSDAQDLGIGQHVSLTVGASLRLLHVTPVPCSGTTPPAAPTSSAGPTSSSTGPSLAPRPQIKQGKKKSPHPQVRQSKSRETRHGKRVPPRTTSHKSHHRSHRAGAV